MTRHVPTPKTVLITGASSGIGAALARAYAAPGMVLVLSGRDRERLLAVAETCRRRGAEVAADTVDVTDLASMTRWIEGVDGTYGLDLVIANAGVSGGTAGDGEAAEQARTLFAVNLAGVLNTVLPAIPLMRRRQRGQIAIVSSVSAYRGMPGAPAYSASKAAVKAYGEALRGWLADDGVRVSVICPGFVVSRITDANDFPMPFLMKASKAAAIIKRGLARDKANIAFPWPMVLMGWLLSVLPAAWAVALLRRLPKKA